MTGAGKVVEAFAYACCAAVGVTDKRPARPFITAAQVLVAAIPKTLRGLCMQMDPDMNIHARAKGIVLEIETTSRKE